MPISSWVVSTSRRVYPSTLPETSAPLKLEVARNEQFSFQLALRNEGVTPLEVTIKSKESRTWNVRTRRVGYVPVRHMNTDLGLVPDDVEGGDKIPGFVPDPLFDEETLTLPPGETHAFWFTVSPRRRADGGKDTIEVSVHIPEQEPICHKVPVLVHDVLLKKRTGFQMTHWMYVDAIIDWYKTDHFDARFWELLQRYFSNMTDHGLDTVYVPLFTPPLDGVKRPTQLLKVKRDGGGYSFDWSDVQKFVRAARDCGFQHFEWSHFFTQWGVKQAILVYWNQGEDEKPLWPAETGATSKVYREFLERLLPEFHEFLKSEGLLKNSLFHVSDEPHIEHLEAYSAARQILQEVAPWMKVMDALSDVQFAKLGLPEIPVAVVDKAPAFMEAGIPAWIYYCCIPRARFLNRLMETPLAKIAMHGALFYRWPYGGFLHWGYNYWHRSQSRELLDPYVTQDAHRWPVWAYGDPFVVYPGPEGPVDSIRWEVFAESLQDYQLLQTVGVKRDDPLLKPLKDFEDFPKTEKWRQQLRSRLFKKAVKS